MRFRTEEFAGPGPGAYPVPEQHLLVRTEEAEDAQQFFDLVVDVKWNEATQFFALPSGWQVRRSHSVQAHEAITDVYLPLRRD